MKLDLDRCRRGMAQLDVRGIPRGSLIEAAIAAIQDDPVNALSKRYLGIKNYAGFGDQREDHEYGMGPRHGSIVFRIGRSDRLLGKERRLDADAIYYLEAYRDFRTINWATDDGKLAQVDLGWAIRLFDALTAKRLKLADAFDATEVQAHAVEAA